jgi:UDP-GlcNAc3NAcA epimerase
MNVISIVGARPQFIKAAAVTRAVKRFSEVHHTLVHTGQHYDENMSEIFFEQLEIPKPDYNVGIGSGKHGVQTGRMLEAIEQILLQVRPDWVLVYGDTNSTLAGALAAVKLHIPVAHVEAGLRSFNRGMPEEVNRVLTDHASDLLFAPTLASVRNLQYEGISEDKILLVGDVMYDAALFYSVKGDRESQILEALDLHPKEYILATVHRAENTDDARRLRMIFEGLALAAKEIPVIVPLHPRTREALRREGVLGTNFKQVLILEPVGYLDMVMLEKCARLIATDSGGVQKEAFFYRVPCVTLRSETEWVELVDLGWNRLVLPTSATTIFEGLMSMLDQCGLSGYPYGNGAAADHIVHGIMSDRPQARSLRQRELCELR